MNFFYISVTLLLFLHELHSWEKKIYPQFQNLTDDEFSRLYLTLKLQDLSFDCPQKDYSIFKSFFSQLPSSLDIREVSPSCIHPITNQFYCGSCYALSAASVLSDRFCIASKGAINHDLSPQFIISCNSWTDGCYGGGLYSTWFFLENYGLPTSSCIPYLSWLGDDIPCDFTNCLDDSSPAFYAARKGSTHSFANKDAMKLDLLNNGPIQVGFLIFGDFKAYKSGVYVPENRTVVGAHAAKLVGWGYDEGMDYWLIGNSWGDDWGESGYFRIKQGEALLENNAIVGVPDLYMKDSKFVASQSMKFEEKRMPSSRRIVS